MSAVEQCSRPRGTMTNCNISPINFIFMHSIVKIIIYYTWNLVAASTNVINIIIANNDNIIYHAFDSHYHRLLGVAKQVLKVLFIKVS